MLTVKLSKLKLKYNCHKPLCNQFDNRQQSSIQKIETDRMYSPRISHRCALHRIYKKHFYVTVCPTIFENFVLQSAQKHINYHSFSLCQIRLILKLAIMFLNLCPAETIITEFRPCDNKTFEYVLVYTRTTKSSNQNIIYNG